MTCAVCNRKLIKKYSYSLCECGTLCDDCFQEIYVIYNTPPIGKIFRCFNCERKLRSEIIYWLEKFTYEFFDSEYGLEIQNPDQ